MEDFIPVEALVHNCMQSWYIDVSALSLNELIELRKELIGNKIDSVNTIDGIISKRIGYNLGDLKMSKRDAKKDSNGYKNRKALMKRRRKGR